MVIMVKKWTFQSTLFLENIIFRRARDDKNFELSYAQKSQLLVDLTVKFSRNCYFWPKIWPSYAYKSTKKLSNYFIFWQFWKERMTTISRRSYTRFWVMSKYDLEALFLKFPFWEFSKSTLAFFDTLPK